jgi:hypothetical protein
VPLPKRLRIRGRNLLHIVTKHGKLASNVVRRHSRFDANETGWQVRKHEMRPRDTFSRNTMAPRESRPISAADLGWLQGAGGADDVKRPGAAPGEVVEGIWRESKQAMRFYTGWAVSGQLL